MSMRSTLPLGFFLMLLFISPMSAQESASAMNNAQQGLADTSWPKKPGNQIIPLSGRMKDVKQIDQKVYASGKEFKSGRLYEDRRESGMASVPMWDRSGSVLANKESSLGTQGTSSWDQTENTSFVQGRRSSLQARENLEQKEIAQKDSGDWTSRASRAFQNEDGTKQMYQGRLLRVRERVAQDDPNMRRDLGEGKKEMYSPAEVKKILEGQPVPIDPLQKAPVKVPIKAESPMASLPSPQGN